MNSRGASRAQSVFERYIGVDYSGAQTPTSSLKGLRVYQAQRGSPAAEVQPPPSVHEDQPSLFTGILKSLQFFGGLPRVAVFDNAKTAVQRVLRGRSREQNAKFREFCGSLALEVEFAAPRRGNEKGGVEGLMGYMEDNFFRPIPQFESLEVLNAALERFCKADMQREHSTHREPRRRLAE